MPRFDHFSWLAPHYDRAFRAPDLARLDELLALPAPGRLLDVGGGTGRISQHLRDRAGQVIVLDESEGMLREARAKGLPVTRAHAERLPFPDGSMDRVLMVDAFHHLADAPQALSELCRILAAPDGDGRPGGRLVIEEPDIAGWRIKGIALAERLLGMRSRFYRAEELVRLLGHCPVRVEVRRAGENFWVIADREG
ncbi:MAG: methyltransferase domain-containing protein [Chloroflexi bacterium]|nr:methyltransferase domain-containing protein [Chloroflexota bacterium]